MFRWNFTKHSSTFEISGPGWVNKSFTIASHIAQSIIIVNNNEICSNFKVFLSRYNWGIETKDYV